MQLQLNRTYRSQCGQHVTIVREDADDEDYPFLGSNGLWYAGDGRDAGSPELNDPCRLVAEVPPEDDEVEMRTLLDTTLFEVVISEVGGETALHVAAPDLESVFERFSDDVTGILSIRPIATIDYVITK